MKPSFLFLSAAMFFPACLRGDTLYQTTPQGERVVIQRDAIVVRDDSSALVYKHFELKERRVVKARLNKGSQPFTVVTTSAADRQRIVETWKHFGIKAAVTDKAGKTTRLYDAYLDFYPPGGRGSLLESVPPRVAIPILLDAGGAKEVEFSEIGRIEFQGDRIKVVARDGQISEGRFLMPTDQPAEVRFLGITEQYDPADEEVFDFSLSLSKIKQVQFEP